MCQPLINDQVEIVAHSRVNYFFELAICFLIYGRTLISTLLQNQLLKQTCFQHGYNETICNELSANKNETKEIEKNLQSDVAEIKMVIELIYIIPTVFALFLGPWSDIYGRRKILISTFIGLTSTLILYAIICYISEFIAPNSPWLYVYGCIPEVLSGGWSSMFVVSLCYITDTTEESRRAYRITFFELFLMVAILLSTLTCNTILTLTDAPTVFMISAVMATFGTIILILFVNESVEVSQNVTTCDKVKSIFSPTHPIDLIKTCFKRRLYKERTIILILISIITLTIFTYNGNSTVGYLFQRHQFGWQLKDANYFESFSICVVVLGSIISLRLFKKVFKISEISLTVLALSSALLDATLRAFVSQSWQMYAISGVTLFQFIITPMCRTVITQIVSHDEIGKVMSLTATFEGLTSFIAAPLYVLVYTKTLSSLPGAFYFISAGAHTISLMFAALVFKNLASREKLINSYLIIENEQVD
jgi:MFS transporter, PCFT/HCP family, solute carrier family 46 (folate transporter), member 1